MPAPEKSPTLTQLLRNHDPATWNGVEKIRVSLRRKLIRSGFGEIGREQIEDILKTAIEKLLLNLDGYSFETFEKVAAFLYITAKRLAIDYLRTSRNEGGSYSEGLRDVPDFLRKYFRIFARSGSPEEKFKEVKTAILNGWYDYTSGDLSDNSDSDHTRSSRTAMLEQIERVFRAALGYRERRAASRNITEPFTCVGDGEFFRKTGLTGSRSDLQETTDGEHVVCVLREFIGGLEKERWKLFIACILNEERISEYWRKIPKNINCNWKCQSDLYAEAGDLLLELAEEFKNRKLNPETVSWEVIEYAFDVVVADLSPKLEPPVVIDESEDKR